MEIYIGEDCTTIQQIPASKKTPKNPIDQRNKIPPSPNLNRKYLPTEGEIVNAEIPLTDPR
jgi:hypothetical protein